MRSPSAPMRVLVVDDETAVANSLGEILALHGFEVFVCYDPALAIIAGQKLKPQVLISDVVMPNMSGFQLAGHYTRHHPQCHVLLVSGNATAPSLGRQAEASGPLPLYLEKPVHPSMILGFVNSCAAPV